MAELKLDREDVNTITADDGTVWVEIASSGTHNEAMLVQGFLEAEGVRAQTEDVKFEEMPINFGAMGDIRIYVLQDEEQRALELLRKREQEYQKIDDDEETLVTDDGPAVIDENPQVESDDGSSTSNA